MARKSSTQSGDLFIGESGQLRLAEKSAEQQAMENRKVECLGMTFATDEERRTYFLGKLKEKLADPEFRKAEGFPIASDEDILAVSDPPYYTACPNPWLDDFIQRYGTAYDPNLTYHREPFAADVTEGKNHPIYNAHSYHTKVPHRAIMRYILHYTEPGDLVLDGFCGTGMTGVAAQLCGDRAEVQELGYRVLEDGTILNEDSQPFSKIGPRRAVLADLSPAATFISHNYTTPRNAEQFLQAAKRIIEDVERELGWMYETQHVDGRKGRINYTVWSDVFLCNECSGELVYWTVAVDKEGGEVRDVFLCPHCNASLSKRSVERAFITRFDSALGQSIRQAKQIPVLINYSFGGKRFEKEPDKSDLALIDKINASPCAAWAPSTRMMDGQETRRNDPIGITHVHHFYTPRNLAVFAAIYARSTDPLMKCAALGGYTVGLRTARFLPQRWINKDTGPMKPHTAGTLYIPSLNGEQNCLNIISSRVSASLRALPPAAARTTVISTQSFSQVRAGDGVVDYLFLDPPFGANINYSELNFLWESWLKVLTQPGPEAIESPSQGKGLEEYRGLMVRCFREAYRLLKPGRWMTIEFSNTRASVWNSIQAALSEAGFIVANVSALDKKQGSFKAVTTPTAVKQDLVISAYKPNGGLEERFVRRGATEEGVWDFVRTHLRNLPAFKGRGTQLEPIAERDPRILFDRMVAFYVAHATPVPLSSGEFQAGLAAKFAERDGMYFLPDQVVEYDKKRAQLSTLGQLSIFVDDERSAIDWLRGFLKDRPSTYQDIQPEFMQQLGAGWKKFEERPELGELLDQNFLRYDGDGDVPAQIHSYLSSQFKELRNLPKGDKQLREKARDRWYVPNVGRQADLEKLREKRLLRVFDEYLNTSVKRLKVFRIEALRVGFKASYDRQDYRSIVTIAAKLPDTVVQEDEQLLMYYDVASMRLGEE